MFVESFKEVKTMGEHDYQYPQDHLDEHIREMEEALDIADMLGWLED
jgi:hypothetical protein